MLAFRFMSHCVRTASLPCYLTVVVFCLSCGDNADTSNNIDTTDNKDTTDTTGNVDAIDKTDNPDTIGGANPFDAIGTPIPLVLSQQDMVQYEAIDSGQFLRVDSEINSMAGGKLVSAPPGCLLEADKPVIQPGEQVTLTLWRNGNRVGSSYTGLPIESMTIAETPIDTPDRLLNSVNRSPQVTTEYTAQIQYRSQDNTLQSVSCTATVFVNEVGPVLDQAPGCSVRVSPSWTRPGEAVFVRVTTTKPVDTIELDGVSVRPYQPWSIIHPSRSQAIVAKVQGTGGSSSCAATIQVIPAIASDETSVCNPDETATVYTPPFPFSFAHGLESKPIATAADLMAITNTNHYHLVQDIDMSNELGTLGNFTLLRDKKNIDLDGRGFSIRNLQKPLFDGLTDSYVHNLVIRDPDVGNTDPARGSLANSVTNTVLTNIAVFGGNVKGDKWVDGAGGMIGHGIYSHIAYSCVHDTKVVSTENKFAGNVGGLAGVLIHSKITNSNSQNVVVHGFSHVGGLVGLGHEIIAVDVRALGYVMSNTNFAGGLVGDLKGLVAYGLFKGRVAAHDRRSGGIAGIAEGLIVNAMAVGPNDHEGVDIYAKLGEAGGIIGNSSGADLKAVASRLSVVGSDQVGGIAGSFYGDMTDAQALGAVSSTTTGSAIGEVLGRVHYCHGANPVLISGLMSNSQTHPTIGNITTNASFVYPCPKQRAVDAVVPPQIP